MSLVGFQAGRFFWKIYHEAICKSFSGKNNSLEPRFFIFEQSAIWSERMKRVVNLDWLGFWLGGIQKCKNLPTVFLLHFRSCRYGFTNYFERPIFICFSNIIARGVSTSELVPPEIKSSKIK